uniref:Bm14453 n=1 Tax=Brugia malayi TaxID=6279 RepID=A0A1I9G0R9_BRUMA|nr:Bm14453 [Brugia malayi]
MTKLTPRISYPNVSLHKSFVTQYLAGMSVVKHCNE